MTKKDQQMHPIHPGELLREILEELDISAYALAKSIGKAPIQISRILAGKSSITAPMARLIGAAVGTALFAAWTSAAFAAERVVPPWPPVAEKIPVVIDTDAACEIDDRWAIALALLCQDRLDIQGFVAANYGDSGGPEGVERSRGGIGGGVSAAGLGDAIPVKRGADPFQYSSRPVEAEGVDFLIERAMAADPSRPLWIVLLGPCTDVASA